MSLTEATDANANANANAPALGKEARAFVEGAFDLRLPQCVSRAQSNDGATKLLYQLNDGSTVETVHMPRKVKNPRTTLCISTQVGCAMGCVFCKTAEMGLQRNLTAGEIVGQVLASMLLLGTTDPHRISLVFMGMGEPLHNLEQVIRALQILTEPAGLGLSPSRITVSTSGLVPGIDALGKLENPPCLALSVNATTDAERAKLMPIGRAYSLEQLRAALVAYPLRPHQKITLEYVLLRGINDSSDDAVRLAAFSAGYRSVVNVIPWNAFDGGPFARPTDEELQVFTRILHEHGALVTVRRSRGRDVGGACGQLATPTHRKGPSRVRAQRRLPLHGENA